jgi:hypothetical protein
MRPSGSTNENTRGCIHVQLTSLTSWRWADDARNMYRNLILCNLRKKLCIKLVSIKKSTNVGSLQHTAKILDAWHSVTRETAPTHAVVSAPHNLPTLMYHSIWNVKHCRCIAVVQLAKLSLLRTNTITTRCWQIWNPLFPWQKLNVHDTFRKIIQTILTLRWLMSYIYGAPILDVSRSHTTTQHSR